MINDNAKTLAMTKGVDLRECINVLMRTDSDSIGVSTLCKDYLKKLDEGEHVEEICESFVNELSKVARSNDANYVLRTLNESVKNNECNITFAKNIYALSKGSLMYAAPIIESTVVEYMLDKNADTRENAKTSLSLFESNPNVRNIIDTMNYEAYQEKAGMYPVNAQLKEEFIRKQPKTYTEDEVNAIIENRVAKAVRESNEPKQKKTLSEIPNRINLHGIITNILKENSHNEKLRMFCEQYTNAMNNGKPDEVLYESFISGISNWNYLNAVDTEMTALQSRIKQYKQEIDLKKILEIMSQTGSYYIVPLIEDVVVDFVENKNMATKALMLQRLESFEYDSFVRDIMNVALRDQSLGDNVYLGESVEMVNNYVKTENVFSPVLYLKENVSVFNVKGTYYKKSGNNISKINRRDVDSLDESFRNLCSLVNSSNVVVSKELNTITVYSGTSDKAVINESGIRINGSKIRTSELENLSATAMMSNNGEQTAFYAAVKVLNENFDNIASIDFVKRISAKDKSGLCVDVFRINENISVNTINPVLGKSTFYKNINPMQCRNYINEHMGINVSPIFEDMLPEQKKTEKKIEERKKDYERYIETLEEKKKVLEKMKNEADSEELDKAIDMIDKEIDDTKDDYKKFQKDADKFMKGDKDGEKDSDYDDTDDDTDDNADDKEKGKKNDNKANDDGEKSKESPEDMEEPITNNDDNWDDDADNVDDDDSFGGMGDEGDDFSDVPEFDPTFDAGISGVGSEDSDDAEDSDGMSLGSKTSSTDDSYRVVSVSYNKNVKSGKTSNKGEVIVIIPSVDANGDVHDDMRKITFTLDRDHNPVVNNEYMPLAMYNAIVSAIENCSDTETITFDDNDNNDDNGDDDPTTPITPISGGSNDGGDENNDNTADDNNTDTGGDDDFDLDGFLKSLDMNDEGEEGTEGDGSEENTDDWGDDGNAADDEDDANFDFGNGDEMEKDFEKIYNSKKNNKPVDNVKRENPAETQEKDSQSKYPISLGIYPEDIAPMKMSSFEKNLDKMRIEHSKNEDDTNETILRIKNKAQKEALKEFIQEWFGYDKHQMKTYLPELCEDDEPLTEGISIKKIRSSSKPAIGRLRVMIPMNEAYSRVLGIKYEKGVTAVTVIAENKREAQMIYNKLYEYSLRNTVDQDVEDMLEYYAPLYKKTAQRVSKYKLTLPYNGFIESKLSSNGIRVRRIDEGMTTDVYGSDYKKVKSILENAYGKSMPRSAKRFIDFLKEEFVITIEDTKSGKTIKINADDELSNDGSEKGEDADFNSSFKDTTFDPAKSMSMFPDENEDSDEENEKDEKDEKEGKEDKDKKKDKEKNESLDGEKKSKKFRFKKKENKEEGTNESLTEAFAKATVLDYVKIPDGRKGQIISQLADGTLIVNVQGHTLPFERKNLKMLKERPDNLEFPVKFDEATLKGIVESYVSCGMFLNNVKVTPNDCKVKLMDYIVAKENDEISIILEGEATKAVKKYIRITDDLNEVFDLANYAEGKMTLNVEGGLQESEVLVNLRDYYRYKNVNEEVCPVRTLIYDENGETHMRYINGTQLRLNEGSDIYVPEYINDLNRAMLLVK